jgi:hypothetical protein
LLGQKTTEARQPPPIDRHAIPTSPPSQAFPKQSE